MNEFDPAGVILGALERAAGAASKIAFEPRVERQGIVMSCADGVVLCSGLPDVGVEELVEFGTGAQGLVLDLLEGVAGIVLLGAQEGIAAGARIRRTGRVLDVPAGEGLLGRVIDPLGRPLDGRGNVRAETRLPMERPGPGVLERAPVDEPLATGIKVIDSMIPIGRGQRELLIGDRGTGKTSIALDAVLSQRGSGVICVYVAVGQKTAGTGRVIEVLERSGAMEYTVVVSTDAEDPPGLKYAAPFAGCSIAEYFRDRGRDALIVYDDLTRHAEAYREISLLLRRPPGREAFPGDIFYLHSRLLERAARLDAPRGGGSLTALPIVETQGGNISAFVPTNLISITDGQIFLDSKLFQAGQLPAVDTGRSVSRVGGKAQLRALKDVSGRLRLDYNQFLELEYFTRFGARVDPGTRRILERGKRIKQMLKQSRFDPMSQGEQVALFTAAVAGAADGLDEAGVAGFQRDFRAKAAKRLPEALKRIADGESLGDEDRAAIVKLAGEIAAGFKPRDPKAAEEPV